MEWTTLQHWLHRSSAADTVRTQRVPSLLPRLTVLQGLHSSQLSSPEANSRFAVRR